MKKTITLILFILALVPALAADVSIQTEAPATVEVGREFSLRYIVPTRNVEFLKEPNFPDGITVLYDLGRSEMSSVQNINGKVTSQSSVTFTYTLAAEKAGTYKIPAATIKVNGKTLTTRAVTIKAVGSAQSSASSQQGGGNAANQPARMGQKITGKDIFIAVTANKSHAYEQEAVVLTYKLYTRVGVTNLSGQMPDIQGFLVQEVNLPKDKNLTVEQVNGVSYQSVVWSQYVVFPQKSGKLEIPALPFTATIAVENPDVDPFDAFFNGNRHFAEVNKEIVAPKLVIDVKKMPEGKPANFSGAVGTFGIKAALLTKEPRTNENLSVRLTVTGKGNMKMISAPKLNLGKDFDVYNPKRTDKTQLTADGIDGSVVFDYVVVPHQVGNYELPSIPLSYFNIAENKYETSATEAIPFKVAQGENAAPLAEGDIRGDISDIHRGAPATPNAFFAPGSAGYYGAYGAVLLLFVAAFVYLKKSERFRNDATLRMRRKAGSIATGHLKQAGRLMQAGNAAEFYDELATALHSYVANRFAVPMSEFKGGSVQPILEQHGVATDLAASFADIISQCEFARYAPGNPQENMEALFKRSSDVINRIENSVK